MYVNVMAKPHPQTLHARRFLALPLAGETGCLLAVNSVAILVDSLEQMLVRLLNVEEAEPWPLAVAPAMTTMRVKDSP